MDAAKDALAGLGVTDLPRGWLLLLVVPALMLLFRALRSADNEPLSLPNKGVPLIGNTLQYIMDNSGFISRAR